MLRQLQGLQENLLKAQEEVAAMTVEASAGGGAVTVTVSGERRIQSITIQPEVVDPEDVEMLQDLIVAAVNQALEQVDKAAAEKVGSVTGGLGLPGVG
jgi:DNA-binding YbaB/EbfC family protein